MGAPREDRPLFAFKTDEWPTPHLPAVPAVEPGRSLPARLRAALPDAALLLLALIQLWPFLSAFHQSADDNFWQFAVLTTLDRPAALFEEVRKLAEQQGRVGVFPAMPLVMAGSLMAEYAWGRVLAVGIFGALLLAFCHLAARRFRLPLTRPALLLALCLTPMAEHHLPPNAFPLLITLPLLGLFALHLPLAGRAGLRPAGWVAADKTGSGGYGTDNLVAVVWPPRRAPLVVASYITGSNLPFEQRRPLHARIGRALSAWRGAR